MTEWFKWERQGAILPLFVCFKQVFQPSKEYCGVSWPSTVMIFKGQVASWCNVLKELEDKGAAFYKWYSSNEETMRQDFDALTKQMLACEPRGKTPTQELNEFLKLHEDWWTVGMLVEPIAIHSEYLLKKALEKRTADKKIFALVSAPTTESFSLRQQRELIETEGDPEKIREHAQKYFWLQNNYLNTQVLGEDYFANEFRQLKQKHGELKAQLLEAETQFLQFVEKRSKTIEELGLDEEELFAARTVNTFSWLQDRRKEVVMQALHTLDVLLGNVGRQKNYSLQQMKCCLPFEVENPPEKSVLEHRAKHCFIRWTDGAPSFEMFTGSEAAREEEKLFPRKEVANEIIEIPGFSASTGRVKGIARVTMHPAEAALIQKGEVLVTSMTSPDFVPAMKKAVAVVTNEGGVTCHAAIISREFGIPCVVGTKIATQVIKTGDLVEVDANHGFVRKMISEKR